jgi:hypothetical protein
MRTQRERLPTVVGEAVVGGRDWVWTTVMVYVPTHPLLVYACQPVAWSGQAAAALSVLLTPAVPEL